MKMIYKGYHKLNLYMYLWNYYFTPYRYKDVSVRLKKKIVLRQYLKTLGVIK